MVVIRTNYAEKWLMTTQHRHTLQMTTPQLATLHGGPFEVPGSRVATLGCTRPFLGLTSTTCYRLKVAWGWVRAASSSVNTILLWSLSIRFFRNLVPHFWDHYRQRVTGEGPRDESSVLFSTWISKGELWYVIYTMVYNDSPPHNWRTPRWLLQCTYNSTRRFGHWIWAYGLRFLSLTIRIPMQTVS